MIINAIVYTACILDPLLYFVLNPDYRAAFKYAWTQLYCNKDPVEVSRNWLVGTRRRHCRSLFTKAPSP